MRRWPCCRTAASAARPAATSPTRSTACSAWSGRARRARCGASCWRRAGSRSPAPCCASSRASPNTVCASRWSPPTTPRAAPRRRHSRRRRRNGRRRTASSSPRPMPFRRRRCAHAKERSPPSIRWRRSWRLADRQSAVAAAFAPLAGSRRCPCRRRSRRQAHARIAVRLARPTGVLAYDDLATWLDNLAGALGERLLRLKGLVRVQESERPLLVQSVGTLFSPPRAVRRARGVAAALPGDHRPRPAAGRAREPSRRPACSRFSSYGGLSSVQRFVRVA